MDTSATAKRVVEAESRGQPRRTSLVDDDATFHPAAFVWDAEVVVLAGDGEPVFEGIGALDGSLEAASVALPGGDLIVKPAGGEIGSRIGDSGFICRDGVGP